MLIHARSTESASRVLTCDEKGPRSHGAGRVCASEGCTTVLSRYNPSAVCCLHDGGWAGRDEDGGTSRRRSLPLPEIIGTCLNPRCQAEFVTTNQTKKYCSDRCRMQAFQLRTVAERRGSLGRQQ